MNNANKFSFIPLQHEHHKLVKNWLAQKHVQPYFYGEGLASTLRNIDFFVKGIKHNGYYSFEHWIAAIEHKPFGFLMTSLVEGPYDPDDIYNKWYTPGRETITLDLLIGDVAYLGKGLAHHMIQAFLLNKFSHISSVLIDPGIKNTRAIHVYKKAGFKILEEFSFDSESADHVMMKLNMKELIKSSTEERSSV